MEVVFPKAPVSLQPHFQLVERRGAQGINAALRVHANVNQSGITEYAEMLGDLRLAETQPADQVPDGPWTVTQKFDDMKTAGLGEGPECGHHGQSNMLQNVYSCQGIFVLGNIQAGFPQASGEFPGRGLKDLAVAFGTKWAYKKYGQRVLSSEAQ
jgi:hypothetical protein